MPAAAQDDPRIAVDRVAGPDRFATSAALAERAAGDRPPRVWIATGLDYPDALSAAATGEPVLLVTRDAVPAPTADALRRIAPDEVVAVGGGGVVSDATLRDAARHAGARAARASGPNRFATAVAVAEVVRSGADVVWLATGAGFADALAAGPVAAAEGAPLLLVSPDDLPADTRQALERLRPATVVVVGGESAVSDRVAQQAASAAGGASVMRLAGPSRYDTAAVLARRARAEHGFGAHVYVATGTNFPDALAAGPAAARAKAPLLLAVREQLTAPTRRAVLDLAPRSATVAGGEAAVSLTALQRLARPAARGACDAYDATRPRTIQGHPERHSPGLDAWSGPWVVDSFRSTWGLAVPQRWRWDRVESFEHGGVLFYVDTEDGYQHWLRVTVFCGNPFLVAGGEALDPNDPAQIAAKGPHTVLGQPDEERVGGAAIYSATWHRPDHVRRYDYVAVDDDVILIHYDATNRFARDFRSRTAAIADAVARSADPVGAVGCPPNASACSRR